MSNRTREELVAALTATARRHHAAYTLFNQAMAEHLGLYPTDLQCVSLVALEPGPRTTGEIVELTGLTSGSATRLVDHLQKASLAERHPDAHDRRKMLVTLTAGRSPEIEAAWDAPGEAFGRALDDFTDDELTVIERYLQRTTDVGTVQTARLRAG
ncbi:MarR family winged helix-turn-helix transcriptional regulator [Streptosporangium roseum]|uniref:MarR family winged helix-turn-helix transcriptional regulator n=1 Tax=Streptosporangium roseum TaxID=2001 RepID=UPI0004CDC521|nr:MarR family transcriptional regulator [Streptosporangium roseum]